MGFVAVGGIVAVRKLEGVGCGTQARTVDVEKGANQAAPPPRDSTQPASSGPSSEVEDDGFDDIVAVVAQKDGFGRRRGTLECLQAHPAGLVLERGSYGDIYCNDRERQGELRSNLTCRRFQVRSGG
jgi:hypothetical protein